MRIDKFLSECKVATRRESGAAIRRGQVLLDGAAVKRADTQVDPEKSEVIFCGERVIYRRYTYVLLNKPDGVVSATEDAHERTVLDLLPPEVRTLELFPCGRLDRDTTGLLIITDDGALAHRIMSPSHHVYKTYEAVLKAPISNSDIALLESGITLADGTECLPAKVKTFTVDGAPAAEIKIKEGKYHQVKRMFAALGNHVEHLRRTRIGALHLDPDLAEGDCRELTAEELALVFTDE